MSRIRGLVHVLILTAVAASQSTAQLKAPFPEQGAPFSLTPGSTFSASTGPNRPASESERTRFRIASEVQEVQAIIGRNHVNAGRQTNPQFTRHAIEGMLRALDPHSNFYDRGEWSELF